MWSSSVSETDRGQVVTNMKEGVNERRKQEQGVGSTKIERMSFCGKSPKMWARTALCFNGKKPSDRRRLCQVVLRQVGEAILRTAFNAWLSVSFVDVVHVKPAQPYTIRMCAVTALWRSAEFSK